MEFGSLADGVWRLAIPALAYTSTLGNPLLPRLYGDINNDNTVEGGTDFSEFGARFGLSLSTQAQSYDSGTPFGAFLFLPSSSE